MAWLRRLAVVAVSFLAGSIPFSNLMARRARQVDLRTVGTGTVSGTGLYRVAGFGPLALAGVCDVAKGAVGPALARREPALYAAAAGAAVAGHNWSIWLGGAGGRGISPALGALAVQHWQGSVVLLAGLVGGRLGRSTALGSLAADAALVPVLARLRGRPGAWAGAAVVAPMLVKRVVGNGRPAEPSPQIYLYRLLYDRDVRYESEIDWSAPGR